MDIIPPEAAHVMSIASANPGSGPSMPTNNALPSSAPVLVVSPAILGTEGQSEKEKEISKSTGMYDKNFIELVKCLLSKIHRRKCDRHYCPFDRYVKVL